MNFLRSIDLIKGSRELIEFESWTKPSVFLVEYIIVLSSGLFRRFIWRLYLLFFPAMFRVWNVFYTWGSCLLSGQSIANSFSSPFARNNDYNERSQYVRVFLLDSDLSLENGTSVRFDKELNQIKNKECLKEMLSVSCI